MKKIFILLAVVTLCIFTSCNNDNTVNPKSELGSATISGTIYAELNNVTDGEEKVANIKVVARVYSGDLVVTPTNTTYGYQYFETTTDSNGKYTVTVPVNKNKTGISVSIIPADFQYPVQTSPSTTSVQTFLGKSATSSVSVYNAGAFLLDVYYNN
jgi:hypothetical protein